MLDVSIIIVSYRTAGLVKQCLRSLRRAQLKPTYEVLVVDNDGTDGLGEMIRDGFPEVKLIEPGRNLGFAAANNVALRQARGRYVLILNPDTEVTPGCLEKMLAAMEAHPDVGILAPKLVHPDRTRQESVHRFTTPLIPVYRRTPLGRLPWARRALDRYFLRHENLENPTEVDWAIGAALFVRHQAIDEVGPLDERYFMYFEDTDWARRFWEKGWKVVYWPEAEIIHYHRRESADGGWFTGLLHRTTRIHISSALKYFLKWWGK